jgi:Glycosyltransferase family 87
MLPKDPDRTIWPALTSVLEAPPLAWMSRTAWLLIVLGLGQIIFAIGTAAVNEDGDLSRQWIVVQYVLRGINPYPIAYDALNERWGRLAPLGPVHLKDLQVYRIPLHGSDPQTDPVFGPPEATYPPQVLTLLLPLGRIPRPLLADIWIVLNLLLILPIAKELRLLADCDRANRLFFVGLVVVWPPVSYCIEREQFSLISLWCILVANRIQTSRAVAAGLLYSLALIKLSLALPFLLLPLIEKTPIVIKLKTGAAILVPQLAALGVMCLIVGAGPRELISGWFSVAAYFRQGTYTIQHVINDLRIDGSSLDYGLQIGILLGGMVAALFLERRMKPAFLAAISCIWMYHARYDFVTLLIPAALIIAEPASRLRTVNLAALVVIGIGLTTRIYSGAELSKTGAVQLAAELSLFVLIVGLLYGGSVRPADPKLRLTSKIAAARDLLILRNPSYRGERNDSSR